jgi:hypothetical protein
MVCEKSTDVGKTIQSKGWGLQVMKAPQKSLKKWTKQKWRTKSGKPSSKTGERYLPEAAIKSLSSAEYAATTKAKREGKAKGKQFVKQPKKIAEKTRKFRASEGGMAKKFPDLTGDGKVTQADILKGRGVKLKKGGMLKKKGFAKGGKMNDMRKTGMFYGGMSRRGK